LTLPAIAAGDTYRVTVDGTPYTGTTAAALAAAITTGGHLAIASGSTVTVVGLASATVEVLKASDAGTAVSSSAVRIESYGPPAATADDHWTLTVSDHATSATVATALVTVGSTTPAVVATALASALGSY